LWLRSIESKAQTWSGHLSHRYTSTGWSVDDKAVELVKFASPELCELKLNNGLITDQGLVHLQDLKLRKLGLEHTMVANLVPLRNMTSLTEIDLTASNLNHEGCKTISTLKNLKHLSVAMTLITDQDLRRFNNLTQLQDLELFNCST